MKIAFLSAYKPEQVWSTPISLIEEFKSRYSSVEVFTTMENNQYTDKNLDSLINYDPDLLVHTDWGQFLFPTLEKLNNLKGFKVLESGDDPQQFERNVTKAKYFDLILSPDIRAVNKYKELGYNAEWWTHFADTRIHEPLELKEKYVAVSSRGRGSSPILDTLADYYPGEIINQNGWEGKEHTNFLNSGKMVIQHSKFGEITRRIFEGMACGKLVITDRLQKDTLLDTLFKDKEEIIFYDNLQDCAEKIAYYNQNVKECKRIATNGYKKVIKNHTQKHRVDVIIQKWENNKNN